MDALWTRADARSEGWAAAPEPRSTALQEIIMVTRDDRTRTHMLSTRTKNWLVAPYPRASLSWTITTAPRDGWVASLDRMASRPMVRDNSTAAQLPRNKKKSAAQHLTAWRIITTPAPVWQAFLVLRAAIVPIGMTNTPISICVDDTCPMFGRHSGLACHWYVLHCLGDALG
jgi:hypothetical protein